MATILLSIKPEYVVKILSGDKKYEYRKHLPQEPVDRIIIYSTDPEKSVVGEVAVIGTLAMSPNALWEFTKKDSGIARSKYRLYFKGAKKAFAFQLGDVTVYDTPQKLSEFGVNQAPQSFIYLTQLGDND